MEAISGMQPPELEIGMPKRHREHIRKNLNILVEWTNYERLAMECVQQGILTVQMLRNTQDLNGKPFNMDEKDVRVEQHRRLLLKITQRGPTAYNLLINALRNINCLDAAVLLESVDESDSRPPFISLNERRTSRKSADIVDTPSPEASEGPCVSKVMQIKSYESFDGEIAAQVIDPDFYKNRFMAQFI